MEKFEELEQEVLLEEAVETDNGHALLVYNDDVNTFDFVIKTLMEVCDHSPEQAEQYTLIIHHNGKCSVKEGGFDFLKPMRNAICERGISAKIQ